MRRRPSAADGFGPAGDDGGAAERGAHGVEVAEPLDLVEQAGDADAGQEDDDVVAILDQRLDPRLDLGGGVDDGLGEGGRPHDRRALALEERGDGVGHARFEHADGAAFERGRGAPGAGGHRAGSRIGHRRSHGLHRPPSVTTTSPALVTPAG